VRKGSQTIADFHVSGLRRRRARELDASTCEAASSEKCQREVNYRLSGFIRVEKLDALVAPSREERKDAILVRPVAITADQMSAVKGWQGLYQVP
jgi:hypothetical protein